MVTLDRSIFDEIEATIDRSGIDEIRERLRPLLRGYRVQTPIFDPGLFLYRARRLGTGFRKEKIVREDLIYPPATLARLGRANRAGQSVFYASTGREAVFFELPGLQAGDEIVLTFWKSTGRMILNNIGYTQNAFSQLGAVRQVPDWWTNQQSAPSDPASGKARPHIDEDYVRELKDQFSKAFCRQIAQGTEHIYKYSTAIAELHLGDIFVDSPGDIKAPEQFAGILYPSIRMRANGDNVALQPWFVDQHLQLKKATHVRIKGHDGMKYEIDRLDEATDFDSSGSLQWLGRLKNWTLPAGHNAHVEVLEGVDDDGDYSSDDSGKRLHWALTDLATGLPIKAA